MSETLAFAFLGIIILMIGLSIMAFITLDIIKEKYKGKKIENGQPVIVRTVLD